MGNTENVTDVGRNPVVAVFPAASAIQKQMTADRPRTPAPLQGVATRSPPCTPQFGVSERNAGDMSNEIRPRAAGRHVRPLGCVGEYSIAAEDPRNGVTSTRLHTFYYTVIPSFSNYNLVHFI